jgi:hypothetical protein
VFPRYHLCDYSGDGDVYLFDHLVPFGRHDDLPTDGAQFR